MRKIKITSFILAVVFMFSLTSLFACDKKEAGKNENEIVFADFENWGPDFQLIQVCNDFGRVTRNKNDAFVHGGKYSAKLQPVGGFNMVTEPCVVFPFSSELFAFDYSDVTGFSEVECYLYNDSETDIVATIGFAQSYSGGSAVLGMGEDFELKSKVWTEAKYTIDCNLLSVLIDVKKLAGLYIQFPDFGVVYPDEAPTIYLDDITIKKADKKVEVSPKFNLYSEGVPYEAGYKKEIIDFENDYQKYFDVSTASAQQGEVKIVSENEVGIMASHGEKMLQVTRLDKRDPAGFLVEIPETLMRASGMNTIPVEKWKEVYFAFDMYLDDESKDSEYLRVYKTKSGGSTQSHLTFVLYLEGRWQLCKYGFVDGNGVNVWEPQMPLQKQCQWTTWRISLYELAYNYRNAVESDFITNPGPFRILFPNSKGVKSTTYLDNFRLETGPMVANGEHIEVVFG
ncbi:MAG: hypothetical protein IJB32_05360 [Clostridia bacterium]|nr:hypothetical protein [Clostridia bacterium]